MLVQDALGGVIAASTVAAVTVWFIIMNHAVLLRPRITLEHAEQLVTTACIEVS
jgi:hypothetical protein